MEKASPSRTWITLWTKFNWGCVGIASVATAFQSGHCVVVLVDRPWRNQCFNVILEETIVVFRLVYLGVESPCLTPVKCSASVATSTRGGFLGHVHLSLTERHAREYVTLRGIVAFNNAGRTDCEEKENNPLVPLHLKRGGVVCGGEGSAMDIMM